MVEESGWAIPGRNQDKDDEAKEPPKLLHIPQWRESLDCQHMLAQLPDARGVDPVSKEENIGTNKHTLARIDLKTVFLQQGKELVQIIQMLLQRVASDEIFI